MLRRVLNCGLYFLTVGRFLGSPGLLLSGPQGRGSSEEALRMDLFYFVFQRLWPRSVWNPRWFIKDLLDSLTASQNVNATSKDQYTHKGSV